MLDAEGLKELIQVINALKPGSVDANLCSKKEVLNAVNLLFKDEILQRQEIFSDANALSILLVVINHSVSRDAALLLSNLYYAGLLGTNYSLRERNLSVISNCIDPLRVGKLFGILSLEGLNPDTGCAQDNLDKILAHPIENLEGLWKKVLERVSICKDKQMPFTQAMFEQELHNGFKRPGSRSDLMSFVKNNDDESSIRPLTESEEKCLQQAIQYYKPRLEKMGGMNVCLESLSRDLVARYYQNPIYLKCGQFEGQTFSIYLPLDWDNFKKYIPEAFHQRALQAYYGNLIHGAYRFFSEFITDKPGPWRGSRAWESLADYQFLVAILWLAASDTTLLEIPNITREARQVFFFESFAAQQRVHNNDKRRQKSKDKLEYYDDGKPDEGGCYLGFKGRAFDSILEHPLFKSLSVVHYELRSFVFTQFKSKINNRNREILRKAWQEIIEHSTELTNLEELNILEGDQEAFINSLYEKYADIDAIDDWIQIVRDSFKFTENFPTHAHRFGGTIDLAHLLTDYQNLLKYSSFTSQEAKDIELHPQYFHSLPQFSE